LLASFWLSSSSRGRPGWELHWRNRRRRLGARSLLWKLLRERAGVWTDERTDPPLLASLELEADHPSLLWTFFFVSLGHNRHLLRCRTSKLSTRQHRSSLLPTTLSPLKLSFLSSELTFPLLLLLPPLLFSSSSPFPPSLRSSRPTPSAPSPPPSSEPPPTPLEHSPTRPASSSTVSRSTSSLDSSGCGCCGSLELVIGGGRWSQRVLRRCREGWGRLLSWVSFGFKRGRGGEEASLGDELKKENR